MNLLGEARSSFARSLLIRLPIAYLCSMAILYCLSSPLSAVILPIIGEELNQIVPGCESATAELRKGHVNFSAQVRNAPPPTPNPARVKASVEVGQLLVAPVIALTLLIAWPRMRRRLATTVWLVLFLMLAQLLDQPFVVADAIMDSVGQKQGLGRDLYRYWTFLLSNGGRQFLGIVAFGLAMVVARSTKQERSESQGLSRDRG